MPSMARCPQGSGDHDRNRGGATSTCRQRSWAAPLGAPLGADDGWGRLDCAAHVLG